MDWLLDSHQYWLIAGIILIIIVLMRQLSVRTRQNDRKQIQREVDLRAAQEAERKNNSLKQPSAQRKPNIISPASRLLSGDPLGTPFTGAMQGQAAKWEAELHALGRQLIGQIDSKMAALQVITLEANRTANRLEVLVEHLEQISQQQIEWQQNQAAQHLESEPEEPVTVIPATESIPDAVSFADVQKELKELADSVSDFGNTVRQGSTFFAEQPEPVTILRLAERKNDIPAADSSSTIRGEVEMLANYGMEPQDIAQRLNISIGEVDVVLQVQRNRLDQTL
jgi:hypothetical protein